ncbi:MAG: cell envelope integrity protein CreD [Hyphomonadaceae bacterium]|nr:cell envelope integrity protein CreD [Hyphomonadaceae bacterium]
MNGARLPSRSLGLKFLLVCALAVLMSLPAFAVFAIIYERTSRAQTVIQEVGQTYGGEQTFIGPVVVAPYRVVRAAPPPPPGTPAQPPTVETGLYMVFADTGQANAVVDTDVRSRGGGDLFKVRTYTADLDFRAHFDLTGEPSEAPEGATVDWSRAAILIGVADPRGAQGRAEIEITGRGTIQLAPGSAYGQIMGNYVMGSYAGGPTYGGGRSIQWLVAEAGDLVRPGAIFDATSRLRFTGVESLGIAAFAQNTDIAIRGDWPDIGYVGAFPRPPEEGEQGSLAKAKNANGFEESWSIPLIARNLSAAGLATNLSNLASADVRVRFVDPSNPYQSVTRALKYALLFLGVVFLAYFLFESTSERRVHPAQYILVGLAQIIFYLLLLAIAERMGFDWAFLIAAGATVTLIGAYLGAIFKSRQRGFVGMGCFAALYALIYLLMRLEDYALLAGSVAAFLAIAAVMWFTRNLDWYGLAGELRGSDPQRPSAPPSNA